VPYADKGRDSIDLNIFGMQGVPRQMIEERILAGGTLLLKIPLFTTKNSRLVLEHGHPTVAQSKE
jgi:hypothetical protein